MRSGGITLLGIGPRRTEPAGPKHAQKGDCFGHRPRGLHERQSIRLLLRNRTDPCVFFDRRSLSEGAALDGGGSVISAEPMAARSPFICRGPARLALTAKESTL
jgi:hypothetical protein